MSLLEDNSSNHNPVKDPLVLWLTGGPGCSVFSAIIFQNGPLTFDLQDQDGRFPSLILNPYAYTKVANIIFLDLPVGTGFSYATNAEKYYTSDTKSSIDAYEFLHKWLLKHPRFINHRLYIAGDSYAGKLVPIIVKEISRGNEAGLRVQLNLQGYFIGNPGVNNSPKNDYEVVSYIAPSVST
ncbi:hypothetical protein Leryth_024654 [Lithospermum erythrorhizon]|nr:hypothetical protein Leryth_024654 [Lithospermum erythrorhizon]